MKHKHCEVIKAWAEGQTCQCRCVGEGLWRDFGLDASIGWYSDVEYRVKPTYPITLNSYEDALGFFFDPANQFITKDNI